MATPITSTTITIKFLNTITHKIHTSTKTYPPIITPPPPSFFSKQLENFITTNQILHHNSIIIKSVTTIDNTL